MQEISVVHDAQPLSAADIRMQVNTIQSVMREVMKEGTHYGKLPGTDQPTLYKPGAEKIMMTFRLAADPEVEDLSNTDAARYRVKVRLTTFGGVFIGTGIGECSTDEAKYKWRKAVCEEEYEATDPSRRREKWQKYGRNPAFKVQQVRTDYADLANTVLKMAKKRALVDAILTATAASDIFTQDIEDLPEEYREGGERKSSTPSGVSAQQQYDTPAKKKLAESLEKEAQKGWDALKAKWSALKDDERAIIGADFKRIKEIAEGVNAAA